MMNWRERLSIIISPEGLTLFLIGQSVTVALQQAGVGTGISFLAAGVADGVVRNNNVVAKRMTIRPKGIQIFRCITIGLVMGRK